MSKSGAAAAQWMWGNAGLPSLKWAAEIDPLRWSKKNTLEQTIRDLHAESDAERPVLLHITQDGIRTIKTRKENKQEAIRELEEIIEKQAQEEAAPHEEAAAKKADKAWQAFRLKRKEEKEAAAKLRKKARKTIAKKATPEKGEKQAARRGKSKRKGK